MKISQARHPLQTAHFLCKGGKEGNYRFYTWINDTFYEKISASEEDRESNFGFGISFDQRHLVQ